MLYTKRSFTLPATEGKLADLAKVCQEHGHMEPDRKGKCIRCGERIRGDDIDYGSEPR